MRAPIGRPHQNNKESSAMNGTIKFFNDERGFGFISRDGGDDVFVHRSNIDADRTTLIEPGQGVEFQIRPGRKGEEAYDVKLT